MMGYLVCKNFAHFLVFLAVFAVPTCWGFTDFRDGILSQTPNISIFFLVNIMSSDFFFCVREYVF